MGARFSVPVSAQDWPRLVRESERILDSFSVLLADIEPLVKIHENHIQRYSSIRKQWVYVRSCMTACADKDNDIIYSVSSRIDDCIDRFNSMCGVRSTRLFSIRE
jgi:hypothetical protein